MLSKVDAFKRIFDMAAATAPAPFSTSGPVWIAGGAAADYDKCGDIDVWFGANASTHAEKFLKSFKYYQESDKLLTECYDKNTGAALLGDAYDLTIGKVIQVLIVGDYQLKDLLNRFDISTHRIGYDAPAHCDMGDGWTTVQDPPKILNMGPKTFSRYIKICQRYGHPVDLDEVKKHTDTVDTKLAEIKSAYDDFYKKYRPTMTTLGSKVYGTAQAKKYEPNSLAELYGGTITDSDVAFDHQALLEDHPF